MNFDNFSMRTDHILSEPSLGQERGGGRFYLFNCVVQLFQLQILSFSFMFGDITSDLLKQLKHDHNFGSFLAPFSTDFYWFSYVVSIQTGFQKTCHALRNLTKTIQIAKQ